MKRRKRSVLRKTVSFLLTAVFLISLSVFGMEAVANIEADTPFRKSMLLVCLDETGYNTDAMMLLSAEEDGKISLLQIPRDTYINVGSEQHKINHLWYRYFSETKDKREATDLLRNFIAVEFAVPIDYAALLDIKTVAAVIDAIGGVEIHVPEGLYYEDAAQDLKIDIPPGTHLLSGKEATHFARYRQGYLRGDLGRLDAQKILMSAIFKKLNTAVSPDKILKLGKIFLSEVTTNITLPDILSLASYLGRQKGSLSATYLTLPGEAARYHGDSGNWYYSLNKKATADVLLRRFHGDSRLFDPKGIFCGDSDVLRNIYFDPHMSAVEYSDENMKDIDIPFKTRPQSRWTPSQWQRRPRAFCLKKRRFR